MSIPDMIITGIPALSCIYWTYLFIRATLASLSISHLETWEPPEMQKWPTLSVIVPARDEQEDIGLTIESLLALDYPALEVIAVDDRSQDDTGRIIDAMAQKDGRVKAIHITSLPDGWLGKVNALNEGFKLSSGKWVLFTDADVRFKPTVLKKAIALAHERNVEHFVLFPKLINASFWLEAALDSFAVLFMEGTKAYNVHKPNSDAYVGVGAFNLARREALERSEGFEWLRLEVADDVGLSLLLKRAGARSSFAFSGMDLHLTWYRTLPEMFMGMSKNLFSAGRYNYARITIAIAILLIFGLSPLSGFMPGAHPALTALCVLALGSTVAHGLVARKSFTSRLLPFFFAPMGFITLALMMTNSALRCAINGGIVWRETVYPRKELQKWQRVKL